MIEKLNYSGDCCSSGVLISFSGFDLALDERYKVLFDNVHTIPTSTNVRLNPTGYFLSSSETAPVLSTFFTSKSNFSDNSSLNIIRLSIYDSQNVLVHTDYKSISCQNLCGSGVPITPTPTNTPTRTPTPTPTRTPQPPPLNIQASFDRTVNKFAECQMLVRAKAYGDFNQTYSYSFGTDMQGVDLKISNPSGFITITELPTYVYTNITLPEKNKRYSLEFGVSNGVNNVQAAAIFSCDDTSKLDPLWWLSDYPLSPDDFIIPQTISVSGATQNGISLRFRQIDTDNPSETWEHIYVPESNIIDVQMFENLEDTDSSTIKSIDFDKVLPNGTYQVEYDVIVNNSPGDSILSFSTNASIDRYRYIQEINNSSISELYRIKLGLSDGPEYDGDPDDKNYEMNKANYKSLINMINSIFKGEYVIPVITNLVTNRAYSDLCFVGLSNCCTFGINYETDEAFSVCENFSTLMQIQAKDDQPTSLVLYVIGEFLRELPGSDENSDFPDQTKTAIVIDLVNKGAAIMSFNTVNSQDKIFKQNQSAGWLTANDQASSKWIAGSTFDSCVVSKTCPTSGCGDDNDCPRPPPFPSCHYRYSCKPGNLSTKWIRVWSWKLGRWTRQKITVRGQPSCLIRCE